MKPRIRKLSNLYFRWGRDFGLSAERIAEILQDARLIERIDSDHYREVETPKVSKAEYDLAIRQIIKRAVDHGRS